MAQFKPERFVVPTQESPTIPVLSDIIYSSQVYGLPNEFKTSTAAKKSTAIPLVPVAPLTEAKTTSSTSTRKPNPAFTTTVLVSPDGEKTTVVGYMIPMSTYDEFGRRIKSGIANARTTVPVEPTALAAYSPDGASYAPVSTSDKDASSSPEATAAIVRPETSSKGLSSGQLAAAIVVPIIVVLLGALLGFLLLRRRKRRRPTLSAQPPEEAQNHEPKYGSATLGASEKMHLGLPFITSTTQNNYNTGLDSMPPSTASGSGVHGTGTTSSALPTYIRNQHGGSNLSNPFTDASGASSSKDSDAFAGFSGVGTDRSSSLQTAKGDTSPARAISPARAVSPVLEVDTRQPRPYIHNDNDNDDAVSDMSDDAEYQEGEVEVAQAHMGRSHRASVITMRGMGSGSSPRGSASGSPEGSSPIKLA